MKLLTSDAYENFLDQKYPSSGNHVGIEIEFFTKCDDFELAQYFNYHDVIQYIQLHEDGSIREPAGYEAWEISICVPEKLVYKVIERVCKALKDAKAQVNTSCGLHVHLDMRNRDPQECFRKLFFSQPLLYSLNTNRIKNETCLPLKSGSLEDAELLAHRPGIEPRLSEFETLEVRMHSGTTNATDINNWVRLLLKIIDTNIYIGLTDLMEYKRFLKLDNQLKTYLANRLRKNKVKPERLRRVA